MNPSSELLLAVATNVRFTKPYRDFRVNCILPFTMPSIRYLRLGHLLQTQTNVSTLELRLIADINQFNPDTRSHCEWRPHHGWLFILIII